MLCLSSVATFLEIVQLFLPLMPPSCLTKSGVIEQWLAYVLPVISLLITSLSLLANALWITH